MLLAPGALDEAVVRVAIVLAAKERRALAARNAVVQSLFTPYLRSHGNITMRWA